MTLVSLLFLRSSLASAMLSCYFSAFPSPPSGSPCSTGQSIRGENPSLESTKDSLAGDQPANGQTLYHALMSTAMASSSRVLAPQRFTALPASRNPSRSASRPSLRVQATAGERGRERQELILCASA